MSRAEQKIGKDGEALGVVALRNIGVEQIERIGTPVTIIRDPRNPGKILKVFYGEPVAADYRGVYVVPPYNIGQSVMAEIKTVEHNLRLSDFQDHQPGKLSEHADLGGLSLVVWVHSTGIKVMRWPIDGFKPGHGLTPEKAELLRVNV